MSLTKIDTKELIFSGNLEDDRTNTYLNLADYDWMQYTLETRFKTKELGTLNVVFEYFGMTTCSMKVTQEKDSKIKEYDYGYDAEIFIKYLKKFLINHIAQWNEKYAFNGEDIVVEFYNEVIEKGYLTDGKDLTKTIEETKK